MFLSFVILVITAARVKRELIAFQSIMDDQTHVDKLGKGLHIAHLNVRSMFGGHKSDILKRQIRDSGVHVFTLSESWLNGAIPNGLVEISGYNMVRADRSWGIGEGNQLYKRSGGLVCYVRKDLKFSESKFSRLNVSNQDL